ncbi:Uncharacterised protein [Vibrio cholerae]|nr:Uncharacterised protein [Vibrio cholerae]
MLQRLLEMLPYLLCLLPIVLGTLHREFGGSSVHQPYVAFRRCYDPVADRSLLGDEPCLLRRSGMNHGKPRQLLGAQHRKLYRFRV